MYRVSCFLSVLHNHTCAVEEFRYHTAIEESRRVQPDTRGSGQVFVVVEVGLRDKGVVVADVWLRMAHCTHNNGQKTAR